MVTRLSRSQWSWTCHFASLPFGVWLIRNWNVNSSCSSGVHVSERCKMRITWQLRGGLCGSRWAEAPCRLGRANLQSGRASCLCHSLCPTSILLYTQQLLCVSTSNRMNACRTPTLPLPGRAILQQLVAAPPPLSLSGIYPLLTLCPLPPCASHLAALPPFACTGTIDSPCSGRS